MGDVTFTAQTRFENNLRLQLNQQTSKLASTALRRDVAGAEKTKLDNLIDNAKTSKKTERNADVNYDATGYDGIWVVAPDPDYLATLVDGQDKLMTGVDLQGGEIMKHAGAIARAKDDAWLAGFYGNLITGKTGTTLNAFPAANVVPVAFDGAGGATPLTINLAKIRRARRILARNFVNLDQPLYMALTSGEIEVLTGLATVMSSDYQKTQNVRMSADGKRLEGIFGFEFIEVELGNPLLANSTLTVDGSGYRKIPFWTADGMVMPVWEELFTSVDKLPTKHFSAQVYSRTQIAASRTDQNRCGYILCVDPA
jgi:hypothetical protein